MGSFATPIFFVNKSCRKQVLSKTSRMTNKSCQKQVIIILANMSWGNHASREANKSYDKPTTNNQQVVKQTSRMTNKS
jgi:hypothetical protein